MTILNPSQAAADEIERLTRAWEAKHKSRQGDQEEAKRMFELTQGARSQLAKTQEALRDVLAHLVAAHALLERSPKSAAPSDKMFDQMLRDHAASIARGRAALGVEEQD